MSPFHIWILKIFMFQHFRSSGRTCTTPHSSQIASGAIFKPTAHKFIIMAMPSGLQEPHNTRRRTICALCQVQLAYMKKRRLPSPPVRIWTKGLQKLVFCRDSPSTIRTRNSELGRHKMPSYPEAANRTWRPCDSGNVFKGPVPGYLGRGPLYSRTLVGCDIFLLLFYSFK